MRRQDCRRYTGRRMQDFPIKPKDIYEGLKKTVVGQDDAIRELSQAGAKRHIEALEDDCPQSIGVVALGHHHRRQRVRKLGCVLADDLEAPLVRMSW